MATMPSPQSDPGADAVGSPAADAPQGSQPLSVAVAIPTRDRPASLARLLGALLVQSRRPDEIVIIDDGQLDGALLSQWHATCQSAGVAVIYHRKQHAGRSGSRNLAARLTSCHIVCFLDDDCEPTPPFLERLLCGMESYGQWQPGDRRSFDAVVAAEGLVIPPGGPRLGDRVYSILLTVTGFWALARTRWPVKLTDRVRSRPFLGGVCAVRRDALKATLFDETMSHGEDREWSVRVARLGRIVRVTDAVCLHHVDPGGRPGSFATGTRIARNFLHSQRKLFGLPGLLLAPPTLVMLAMAQAILGLMGVVALRPAGRRWLAQSAGLLAGLFTPHGRRAD